MKRIQIIKNLDKNYVHKGRWEGFKKLSAWRRRDEANALQDHSYFASEAAKPGFSNYTYGPRPLPVFGANTIANPTLRRNPPDTATITQ